MLWFPRKSTTKLTQIVQTNQDLFRTTPGTTAVYHYISTTVTPVHIPPHCVPAHIGKKLSASYRTSLKKAAVIGWLQQCLWGRRPESCKCVLTIKRSTGKQNQPYIDHAPLQLPSSALSRCTVPRHSCSATLVPLQASREKTWSAQQQDSTNTKLYPSTHCCQNQEQGQAGVPQSGQICTDRTSSGHIRSC